MHESIYPETHDFCELKMLGKKSSIKSAKKRFLYSHEYRDLKMGEKTRETIFYVHTYSAGKKWWEKIVG